MLAKNRKFNVAGTSFHSGKSRTGSIIFLAHEPENIKDNNAIQVLNGKMELIGYLPRELAKEVIGFKSGKFPHYCAKVVELWKVPDGENKGQIIPKVLSHFANKPEELPYTAQPWVDPAPINHEKSA